MIQELTMTTQVSTTPKNVHLLGNLIHFKARGSDTGNAYSLVEVQTAPGAGTPPHVQNGDDEAFFVLEGRYEFMHNGQQIDGVPGTFVFIRRGEPHAFRNGGDRPARMLIVNSPGGLHEKFFLEAGDEVAAGSGFPPPAAPDMPRLGAAADRYGIAFL
jgi:quercetin dioxygenase-like cupin family protein